MNRQWLSLIVLGAMFLSLGIPNVEAKDGPLPLADIHFHVDQSFVPSEVLLMLDHAGVRWAGNGAKGPDNLWRPFVEAAPDRFLPFAGQGAIGHLIQGQGEAVWNLKSPEITRYLESLEQGLRAGRFRGIGELFVNNQNSHRLDFQATRYPADSPLMRRLLTLAATYHTPLSVHMEADPGSVEELERLLPLNRKGLVIWAHCGFWIEADQLQKLLDRHPNLFCEFSHREGRPHLPQLRVVPITGSQRQLKPDWKALLENHSDRFLIGTDVKDLGEYQSIIDYYREILAQLSPAAAKRLAYENAQRLFGLSQLKEIKQESSNNNK